MNATSGMNSTEPGVLQPTDAFSSWDGGVLFVIAIDAAVFGVAALAFLVLRRYALSHAQPQMQLRETSGLLQRERLSFFQEVIHRTFRRFNTMSNDTDPGWFSWIWATISMPGEVTLERCGRDGYLYLKMQRLYLLVLFLASLVSMPVLLPLYLNGDDNVAGFSRLTGKNLSNGSIYLWVPAVFTVFITVLVLACIFLLFKSIRKHSALEKKKMGVDARLYTIKINHFPRNVFAEQELEQYFEYLFPGHVLQVYIVLDLGNLEKLWHKIRQLNMKIYHYQAQIIEDKNAGVVYRPKMVPNFCGLRCCCGEEVDAIEHYQEERRELREEFEDLTRSATVRRSTGVAFVTFRTLDAINAYLKRFGNGDLEKGGDISMAPARTPSGSLAPLGSVEADASLSLGSVLPLVEAVEERAVTLGGQRLSATVKATGSDRRGRGDEEDQHSAEYAEEEHATEYMRDDNEDEEDEEEETALGLLLDEEDEEAAAIELMARQAARQQKKQRARSQEMPATHSHPEGIAKISPAEFLRVREHIDPERWYVTRAPAVQNIQWQSLSAGTIKMVMAFLLVNGALCVVLFFFTTPLAMLGGLQKWGTEYGYNYLQQFEEWISTTGPLGAVLIGYLPSLILLGITAVLPHIIYFTTLYLEIHHTSSSQHRAGMSKVFLYQTVAILVLPTLAITSVQALITSSIDDLEQIVANGGLFPNGVFFVKYVVQAALLGGAVDLFRGPEIILEKWKKWNAETLHELEEAEKVPPFKFGYEYSYTLLVLTIVLFYSTVVPIILPAGFIFICIKHFIDKYNLVHVYPKSPPSANYMTKAVVLFMMIGLNLYLIAMISFLYFSKHAVGPTTLVVLAFLFTNVVGAVLFFGYFRYVKKKDYAELAMQPVDVREFIDAYLHPALKNADDAFLDEDLVFEGCTPLSRDQSMSPLV
eukprot:TRINITY_DN10743_c1_g1_i1.p1 TRINITY_DN10743_c1_g1~~TRINITY_DN10743_c1_g1_i1.p1  ORF type:complete len:928 (+),score=323.16 TRINITY_DN10743_c1_g1_i1:88-2871(+)